jgi:hypothetical protein
MLWQGVAFCASVLFFHSSEYLLAAAYMRDEFSWKCELRRSTALRARPGPRD